MNDHTGRLYEICHTLGLNVCAAKRGERRYEVCYSKSYDSALYSFDVFFTVSEDSPDSAVISIYRMEQRGADMKAVYDAVKKKFPSTYAAVIAIEAAHADLTRDPFIIFDKKRPDFDFEYELVDPGYLKVTSA